VFELRPLIVVTGAISARGGAATHVVNSQVAKGAAHKTTITRERTATSVRLHADVIVSEFSRRLRGLRLLKTPFGGLFDRDKLVELTGIFDQATHAISDFNKSASEDTAIINGLVWEHLSGNRLAAVQGWAAFHAEASVLKKVAA
jgi:hypothetical protein